MDCAAFDRPWWRPRGGFIAMMRDNARSAFHPSAQDFSRDADRADEA